MGPEPFELLAEHRKEVWRRKRCSCSLCAVYICKLGSIRHIPDAVATIILMVNNLVMA